MPKPWEVSPSIQKATPLVTKKKPWEVGYSFTPSAEFNAVRSGAVDFVESAIGLGDELDATVRVLSGEADNYSQAIQKSRAELDAFEKANPTASAMLDIAGLGAGLFIPGASLVKVAQTGSKLDRAIKVGTLGAAEGAAYGYLSGRDEGRLEGAALGAGLGAGLGAAASTLTRNADEIAAAAKKVKSQRVGKKGGFIGGEEGFANVGRAGKGGNVTDTSLQERNATTILVGDGIKDNIGKASRTVGNILLGTKEWTEKNVGARAARLIEDSEILVRHELHEIDTIYDDVFANASKVFDNNPTLKTALLKINNKFGDKAVSWDQALRLAKTAEEVNAVKLMRDQVKVLKDLDFVKFPEGDYMPTIAVNKSKVMGSNDYANPVEALKQYAKDIATARAVAKRFNINIDKINLKEEKLQARSRIDSVFKAIDKAAKKELKGAANEKAIRSNLQDALRSTLITSKMGGDAVGAVSRRAVSTALLANPMNAVLNIIEGVTAPVFQNGIKAWAQTVPRGLIETFPTVAKITGVNPEKWVSNKQLGLDRNFYGEVANTVSSEATKTAEVFNYIKAPELLGKGVDVLGKLAYKVSGVEKVNRMGQEMLSNSAVQRAVNLAKAGDAKSIEKLKRHDGMRGLSQSEFNSTVNALQKMKQGGSLNKDELGYVLNFAGASMNKWQPVSASAMPRAYNDNPNARMMYSMLSYMNRQMNNIRTEVGLNLATVAEKGINTKEGAEAAKTAMIQTGKYVALFGILAGVWDDARKTLDLSKNKEIEDVLTPEGIAAGTLNQIASNISSGAVNIRAEEFGGQTVSINPAPVQAISRTASGLLTGVERAVTGEPEALTPLLRTAQTYAPGLANIDRILRMTSGERLLTDD